MIGIKVDGSKELRSAGTDSNGMELPCVLVVDEPAVCMVSPLEAVTVGTG